MILRRVIAHVRKQEWTAIAIDFLIVVVGVFIGIQVANWNDARHERSMEATYLKSLRSDLTVSIDLIEAHLAHLSGRQAALSTLANANKEEIVRDGFDALMRAGLYDLEFLDVQRNTYQALENAGRIGLLRDLALQRALVSQSMQIAAIRDYEADMARFQHRWVDEFLLADYYLGNIISFDAVGVDAVRDNATDYRNLLDNRKVRNLAAFLYDILSEQRKHAEELRREYAVSASLIETRLEIYGDN